METPNRYVIFYHQRVQLRLSRISEPVSVPLTVTFGIWVAGFTSVAVVFLYFMVLYIIPGGALNLQ